MHDTLAMRAIERIHDFAGNVQRVVDRQRTALKAIGQRLALDVFHDEKAGAVLFAHVVQRADMGVIQTRDGLRFALESPAHVGVVGEVLGQHLDGNRAAEPRVGGLVDLAHPAGADGGFDSVGAERSACR